MDRYPVRLVVRDDLQRSRLTVLFRLLLAIPHYIWMALWGIVVLVAAVANWAAVLVTGRSPAGLHGFLSRYIRYLTHVGAYMALAADPYPFFDGREDGYPVSVVIDPPQPQRRLTVLLRIVVAVPALFLTGGLGSSLTPTVWQIGSGGKRGSSTAGSNVGLSGLSAFLGWFACLVTGRMPLGLRNIGLYTMGYQAQTLAYALCLTDRYPYAGPEPGAPASPSTHLRPEPAAVTVAFTDDLRRSRLTVFFRPLLAVPHFVWLALWGVAAVLAAIAGWFAALATGRLPGTLHRFLAAYVRYGVHVQAFLSLTGNPFPGFTGTPGTYPVDATIAEVEAQPRWTVLVRIFLALPALCLSSAVTTAAYYGALLMWFVGIFTGRAPQGLRNLGVYAARYSAETNAYALLLTPRYPYSGPEAGFPLPEPEPAPEPETWAGTPAPESPSNGSAPGPIWP